MTARDVGTETVVGGLRPPLQICLLRMPPGRNELFGMLAPERRRINERNSGPGDDGFRRLNDDSHVRPLRHAPHLIDVHFFNEPSGCKPIVQAWKLSLEEQFVLVSR